MNEFGVKTLLDVKWKVVRPVRAKLLIIVPGDWKCRCLKWTTSYRENGCLCFVTSEISTFPNSRRYVAQYIVHVHNERLDIKCDRHPGSRATIYATPDIELNPPQRLCWACVGSIMETSHYQDVWFWNMDGTGGKWLSQGTIHEKEQNHEL